MQVRLCATLGLMVAGVLGCSEEVGVSQTESELHSGSVVCSHHDVVMCHAGGTRQTICVPPSQVPSHLANGDTLGPCGPEERPPQVECGDGTVLVDGECVSETPPVACGPGTVEQNGLCVPDNLRGPGATGLRACAKSKLSCGPGTVEQNGLCVVENPLVCGPGTVAQNGQCVVQNPLTCGPGTVAQNGQCVVQNPLTCGPGTIAQNGQCVVENPLTCGPGTVGAGGVCSPDYTFLCATGTVPQNGQCVVANPLTCGNGTIAQGGQCTPDLPAICAAGTVAQGGQCVVSNPLVCGPGTVAQNGQCVPQNPLTCGAGTVAANGQCVPDLTTLCGVGTVAQNGVCVPAGSGTCDANHVSVCECAEGDDDHDGVCNDADACLGYDDRIDTDGDGFPDGCDTDTDAFEPNDVTPYPQRYFPLQVFPTLSGATDIDRFSFTAEVGHMIVFQVCAFLSDTDTEAPLAELRLGDQVLYTNVQQPASGCIGSVFIPAAQTGTYVLTLRQRQEWGDIPRLIYALLILVT